MPESRSTGSKASADPELGGAYGLGTGALACTGASVAASSRGRRRLDDGSTQTARAEGDPEWSEKSIQGGHIRAAAGRRKGRR